MKPSPRVVVESLLRVFWRVQKFPSGSPPHPLALKLSIFLFSWKNPLGIPSYFASSDTMSGYIELLYRLHFPTSGSASASASASATVGHANTPSKTATRTMFCVDDVRFGVQLQTTRVQSVRGKEKKREEGEGGGVSVTSKKETSQLFDRVLPGSKKTGSITNQRNDLGDILSGV